MRTSCQRKFKTEFLESEIRAWSSELTRLRRERVMLERRVQFLQIVCEIKYVVERLRAGHVLDGATRGDHLKLYKVDVAAIKATTVEEYKQQHLDFVQTAALLLPHAHANGDSRLVQQLVELVDSNNRFNISMLIWNTPVLFAAKSTPLVAGWPAAITQQHAEHVVSRLDWTGSEENFEMVCMTAAWHLKHLERLSGERAQLTQRLAAATSAGDIVAELELVAALSAAMDDFVLVNTVAGAAMSRFLTPNLAATMHVLCYPYVAVVAALGKAILNARESQEQHGGEVSSVADASGRAVIKGRHE